MPFNSPIQKQYFSISEVADMLGVNASLLRFWEKEFKQIQPKTNSRGKRSYRAKDIEVLRAIYVLVKEQGFTLEGARKALSARKGALSEAGKVAKQAAKASVAIDTAAQTKTLSEEARKQAVDKLVRLRTKLLNLKGSL